MAEQREVWLSEYGADCFDVSNVDRCDLERAFAAGKWFPLHHNDKLIGHVKIDWDRGSTSVVIRALKDNTLEVRTDPDADALYERLRETEYGTVEYRELEEQLEKLDEEIQRRREAA